MIAGILKRAAALTAILLLGALALAEDLPQPEPLTESTVQPTQEPTTEPTAEPTQEPTAEPTAEPTLEPTPEPTQEPTAEPTAEPIQEPTAEPTAEPTVEPTVEPTPAPTNEKLVLKKKSGKRSDRKLGELAYLDGGMRIPVLFQYDYDTVIAEKGEMRISVSTSGCGTTALSMAIAYLTGNVDQTPYTILYAAVKDGIYRAGSGIGHGGMSKLARRYGLSARWVSASEKTIKEALEAGNPVIAHMGEGEFTDEGHYILLRGLDEDGRVYVTDPNSLKNSKTTYSLWAIFEETKTDAPFMILSLPEPEKTQAAEKPVAVKRSDSATE